MAKPGKNITAARTNVEPEMAYEPSQAMQLVIDNARAKFVESIDVAVNLGVDPRKSDQVVRGSTVLPNGTGKVVRVTEVKPVRQLPLGPEGVAAYDDSAHSEVLQKQEGYQ